MDGGSVIINIDIDTTGLKAYEDQVCRIFAFDDKMGHEKDHFSTYLMPTCEFTEHASSLNKFTIRQSKTLLLNGKPVTSVSQREGFQQLYEYIHSKGDCILISHYAMGFLARFLVLGFEEYMNISAKELDDAGIKFADSYLMIKPNRHLWLRDIENLKEPTIHQYLFPTEKPYATPNARNDAIALHEILEKLKVK